MFTLNNLVDLLNSNFTSALAGALAGAFAGALAAQRAADRSTRRKELVEELRNVNAAIVVAFTICNTALGFKKQLVKPTCDAYATARNDLKDFAAKRASGEIPPTEAFAFQADLQSLHMPMQPMETLRTHVFERVSVIGRPLALVSTLDGTHAALVDIVEKRNGLIERFRTRGPGDPPLEVLYFALPYGAGHISTEFKDAVEGMGRLTDDMIFFSQLLAKDLEKHGEAVLSRLESAKADATLRVSKADFRPAVDDGLMPSEHEYADWLKGFKDAAQPAAAPDAKGALAWLARLLRR